MSSDAKIPEWANRVAFEAQTAAIEECKAQRLGANYDYPFVTCRSKEVLDRHIANALLAAEQRGRKAGLEEAAEYVLKFARVGAKDRAEMQDKRMLNLFVQMEAVMPAAIRSLGEKP